MGWRWTFPLVGVFGALVTTWMIFILPKELPATVREGAGKLNGSVFVRDLREILGTRGMPFATLAFTLALAWLGYALWSERRASASQSAPASAGAQLRPAAAK